MTSQTKATSGEDATEDPASGDGTAAVRSVLMAVRVLEAMALAGGPLRVSDLARRLAEPKGRVHRHLVTLRQAGLVAQEETTERYHLTWRMFQIGQAAGEQFDLKRVAEPAMHRLRDAVGQSVLLAVPTGGDPLVVHALEAPNKVLISVQPGNRPPAHCSAQGRIMLAFGPAEALARTLGGTLEALTPHSLTDPGQLRDRLELVRQRLWETAPSEALLGINLLAAPIFAAGEVLVGSLGIVGSVQFVQDPPDAAMLAALHEAAGEISLRLGAARYGPRASGGTKSRQ
ncbi:IclR family transcriptional regulator [Roseomonas frigidaquae]|uniref:IclR family transcriptional regulator n=1 Tax=Falsiroseomonas frigidaquae TaxID=487318 RepID=A0ABX1F6V6_9PROT|nr:IclR family transcriptional regulator [Falsiroseomonas frigidaquae]NKE48107.1 IclR family transcriptional regulator [Falsiroseomonas frigidaquae]